MARLLPPILTLALVATLTFVPSAVASQFVERDATGVRIALDARGDALLTYRVAGVTKRLTLDGSAVNAVAPVAGGTQVHFTVRYLDPAKPRLWARFVVRCRPYDGPTLPFQVAACKAPDGSYWAAQNWPTPLPDLGFAPWTPAQKELWLHVSHWTGELAKLEVWQDWVYDGRFQELIGRYTYRGKPVYGFGTTNVGAPTDGFGRLIYLDTFGSAYGSGWRRENSFVPHNPTGAFCYGFYPFDPTKGGYQAPPGYSGGMRGPGTGSQYRLIAEGPGVTPDVEWQGPGLHPFDKTNPADVQLEQQASQTLSQITARSDHDCRNGHVMAAAG